MRKSRKFTPSLIKNWEEKVNRGQGIHSNYIPWHQASRSDPGSRGRSHLEFCPRSMRHKHFLSDGEYVIYGFALMIKNAIDIREQYKLEIKPHENALSRYSIKSSKFISIGTIGICNQLGIKHPVVQKNDIKEYWRFSTDILITIKYPDRDYKLLAVSVKESPELENPRKCSLLNVEKIYWETEGADWILVTEKSYCKEVGSTVIRCLPWVVHPTQIDQKTKLKCASLAKLINKKTLKNAILIIEAELKVTKEIATLIFWQTIWSGLLPIDLSISRYISDTIDVIPIEDFLQQNPLYAVGRMKCL